MTELTRRTLVRMAAGLAAAHAVRLDSQAPAPSSYIGPLTGVTSGLEAVVTVLPPTVEEVKVA